MRPPFHSSIVRLGVRPDEPDAVVGPRPRGSRRPHTDAKVAAVRRLIEQTTLTYSEIAAKTGVGRASICRWTRDGRWQRPLFAPRATDTVPSARAGARLKLRTLFARLAALAERYIRELEAAPGVDPDKLAEALELLKMAKLAARPRRRRPPAEAAAGLQAWEPVRARWSAACAPPASTPNARPRTRSWISSTAARRRPRSAAAAGASSSPTISPG